MNRPLLVVCLLCLALGADLANGQGLFGNRRLGGTLSRRPGPGVEGAGTLTGNERFIRGARGRDEFVGADTVEMPTFVGVDQGRGRGPIRSAIGALINRSEENVNRPQPPPPGAAKRPYPPRLSVAFEYAAPQAEVLSEELTGQLERSLGPRAVAPLEVHLGGRTAILRGAVATEHDRTLAAELVRLAPGVDQVQNELQVGLPEAAPPAGDGTPANPLGDTDPTPPGDR